MKRQLSLLRSAALAVALAAAATGAVALILIDDTAYASGRGSDDDDGPDWDDDDHGDDDNSGHGGGDDFDDFDDDNSGPGNGDDDFDDDNSGPGSGDDDFDGPDVDDDNSGPGNGDDDDDDHSGPNWSDDDGDDHVSAGAHLDEHAIYSVEYDSHGDEFMPGEIVFVGRARDLAVALNLGFQEIRVQNLTSGGIIARLALPRRTSMERAAVILAEAAPDAIVTPNNIYRSAQTSAAKIGRAPAARRIARSRGTLGVIDTGVDAASLAAADAVLSQQAFAGPQPVAREHGSTVAAIAVSRGVRVHVADVFGQSSDGALAASADRIAAAIDWMIEHRIAVVNISVEGPDNAILAEMVRRAAERGHIIVAAAGNGGPAALPTFPAAFDGVLAVTAIDETGRPYIRANRGAYIDFAAHGVNVSVDVGGSSERVSGTSFAAPFIAAEAAAHLHTPSPTESARVLTRLRDRAEDLGAPGRDNVFGWGALRD